MSVLIIGLMLPTVISLAHSVETEVDDNMAESCADGLVRMMTDSYYGGTGNGRMADISIPTGYELRIGGPDQDGYIVRICHDGEIVGRVMIENPSFPVMGDEMSLSGTYRLSFCPVIEDGIVKMEVRVL